ncbi:MAG: hypothetical protein A3B03_01250 [Candidatus Zambryskibacteria bacterium RIFCSPLOWO2_01_FULL_42_41]|nr:MAG: hypothetical protein A3B03_01250 [Candidatus Zambryskibacteria bacterium RIFCSPLOWO2_01_FULL_42_41]
MAQIRYVPIGHGRYRRIFRKKKSTPKRKPLGPPAKFPIVVTPFHQLPVHLQAFSGKDRASGERDD